MAFTGLLNDSTHLHTYDEKCLPDQDGEDVVSDYWAGQCQKYEERIVELHSVIAELTKKLEDTSNVIKEESEFEEASVVTDSCLEDEENDSSDAEDIHRTKFGEKTRLSDKASLAFEEALQDADIITEPEDDEHLGQRRVYLSDIHYKADLFDEMEKELFETRARNEKLLEMVNEQAATMEGYRHTVEKLNLEKENVKRQLEDLRSTLEFQETKMDRPSGSSFARSSSVEGERRRRSLRRRKISKSEIQKDSKLPTGINQSQQSLTPSPNTNRPNLGISRSVSSEDTNNLPRAMQLCKLNADDNLNKRELDLAFEVDRLRNHTTHLESHNQVLCLSLEDVKMMNIQLSNILEKRESNESSLHLSLQYCDAIIEAYDVLVALLETENSVLQHTTDSGKFEDTSSMGGNETRIQRARRQRKSAEKVARHVLQRLEKTLDQSPSKASTKRTGGPSASVDPTTSSPTGCWEDSSGYSQTASSTASTTSASSTHLLCGSHDNPGLNLTGFTKHEELRLRDCISHLKTVRASIQLTVLDVESVKRSGIDKGLAKDMVGQVRQRQIESEEAVTRQELMASREERADLKAKIYLLEKESAGLKMVMIDKDCMEEVLRTRIQHLEEIMNPKLIQGSEEKVLHKRINNLFLNLDKVSKNANERHRHAIELIEELRKANSTLTKALDQSKRKYQSKLKKMEQQHHQQMFNTTNNYGDKN